MSALLLAVTVMVVTPEATGLGAADAAAELGGAVERALAGHPKYQRVGDAPMLPSELVTVFACERLEPGCASRAGKAAGTDAVLLGRVVRLEAGVEVELQLVSVAAGTAERSVLRFVRTEGAVAGDALRPVLDALVAELLDGTPAADTLSPELVVSSVPPVPPVERGVREVLGWTLSGAGAAAVVGAAAAGILMSQTQARYDRATDGLEVERLADEGRERAAVGNVLWISGSVALSAGIVLLLLE